MEFGERLKELRTGLNISQKELSEKTEILTNLTGQKIYPISGYTGNGIEIVLKKTLESIKIWQNPEK